MDVEALVSVDVEALPKRGLLYKERILFSRGANSELQIRGGGIEDNSEIIFPMSQQKCNVATRTVQDGYNEGSQYTF